MRFEEFVGHVQHRARLGTQSEAMTATRATLETLAERLFHGEREKLAAQLPREIGECMRHVHASERFDVDDFFRRVGEREAVDLPVAVHHARVVAEVLREAMDAGAFAKLEAQLPAEFQPLFAGCEGRLGLHAPGLRTAHPSTSHASAPVRAAHETAPAPRLTRPVEEPGRLPPVEDVGPFPEEPGRR